MISRLIALRRLVLHRTFKFGLELAVAAITVVAVHDVVDRNTEFSISHAVSQQDLCARHQQANADDQDITR